MTLGLFPEILCRLQSQSGVIVADEVGMGRTFVAMAVAYSVAKQSPRDPVIVMVPANLVDKWEQDVKTACELYLDDRRPVQREGASPKDLIKPQCVRYRAARHSIDFMKLLDDPPRTRCHLIFLAQGAMARRQTDKWNRLALIAETLRRHGRGKASRLIQVKNQITAADPATGNVIQCIRILHAMSSMHNGPSLAGNYSRQGDADNHRTPRCHTRSPGPMPSATGASMIETKNQA